MGEGERESGRELHHAALHNLHSNIMTKEGKVNYEAGILVKVQLTRFVTFGTRWR
jgi:hypothetical protein